jgi:hypothetical protein
MMDNLTGLRRINGLKRWCIENYVPLKQFKRGEIHLAFCESFCEKPESELAIFAHLPYNRNKLCHTHMAPYDRQQFSTSKRRANQEL